MQSLLSLVLFGSIAAGQIINCKSFGIPDDYQGHKGWRASTKDCAEATNKLEDKFGQTVPEAEHGCVSLATSGECEISMCDSSDVKRPIGYETAWLAARVVHGRHKEGGNVAGYVSLDDYFKYTKYKAFVKVAKKNTPDPGNKRRALFGRRSGLDETQELPARTIPEELPANITEVETREAERLGKRTEGVWSNNNSVNIPNTNGLSANIRVASGAPETMRDGALTIASENLLTDWRTTQGRAGSVAPRAYRADAGTDIAFEWIAHNNHNVGALTEDERREVVDWAIQQRNDPANDGARESFGAQIRRAGQTLGFILIRVFYIGLDPALANVCG